MARKPHKYHYIYKTTCLINEKFYIGMHSTDNLEDNYIGSGKRLWLSIRKYGKENFSIEILEYFPDRNSLKKREIEIVNEELLKNPLCMNLKLGGYGGISTPEHLEKWRIASKLITKSNWENPIVREKMIHSLSENMKIRHQKGLVKYDTLLRKHRSEETRKKISESSKILQKGEKNSQFGKKWIWMFNSVLNKLKKVSLNEVEQKIQEGYKKGRK